MKRYPISNLYVIVCLFCTVSGCHGDQVAQLKVPEPISALVTEVMDIKTAAMKLPAMRSEDGVLGKQVEGLMDQIAKMAGNDLLKQAERAQQDDIRAKIILWARDRQKRPEEYRRFAKWYVNRPIDKEAVTEYFYRPWKDISDPPFPDVNPTPESFTPRPGTWAPHPIDKEDVVEANRLLMEYCFFMPPTGKAFDNEDGRYHLVIALISLGETAKSYGVFVKDTDIWFECFKDMKETSDRQLERALRTNLSGLSALRRLPCETSFKKLGRYSLVPLVRLKIANGFGNLRGSLRLAIETDETKYETLYRKWMSLAKEDWEKPEEVEFARLVTESMKPPFPKR